QAKPYSDLDLAIDPPLPAAEMDALREAFRESPLPWKVDLVELAKVGAPFRRIIESTGVRIFPVAEGGPTRHR
ncbi:MAG: nucleotidyltransferase domain-containing protein, partial [Nitrospirae bacterium]